MKNLYSILGLKDDATTEEIKIAHRKLIKKHHPDKNGGQASEVFLNIQKAYEILSNPQTRNLYDEHGFTEADNNHKRIMQLTAKLIHHCISIGTLPDQLINEMERQEFYIIEKLIKTKDGIEEQINKLVQQKDALKMKNASKIDMIAHIIMDMMRQKKAEMLMTSKSIEDHQAIIDIIDKYEKGEIVIKVEFNSWGTSSTGTAG